MFYAIQTYTPTVLLKEGNTLGTSFLLTSIFNTFSLRKRTNPSSIPVSRSFYLLTMKRR
jgi:hypothetical protein